MASLIIVSVVAMLAAVAPPASASGDTQAPVLVSLSASPPEVDVSISAQQVLLSGRVTDAGTGVDVVTLRVERESIFYECRGVRVSGDGTDGVYQCSVTVPQNAPSGSWATAANMWDVVRNLGSGTGSPLQVGSVSDGDDLEPDQPAPGEPGPEDPVFSDVSGTHADSIAAVVSAGIARGYEDGTFRPGQPVTRGQMATFLVNALQV